MEKLVNKTTKRVTKAKEIINPTKNVKIYYDESAVTPSYDPHSTTGSEMHWLTNPVRTELIYAFMSVQNLLHTNPELINPDLEISDAENFTFVKNFTIKNKESIVRSLDETIKRIAEQTDFQSLRSFDSASIQQLIEHLYGRYSARCARQTVKEETLLINKCIKMLLEAKVKGVEKSHKL